MIEIERKFRLSPDRKAEIEKEIQTKHGPIQPVRQVDEVFLCGIDSFADFKQGMPIARLRTQDDVTTFAYKRRINDAGDMVEHELAVGSDSAMRAILKEMDYRPVTRIDKMRLEAKVDGMALALDTVRGLGDFLEIEVMATDDGLLDVAEKNIMEMARDLGLSEADLETRKYDQMMALLNREG